MINPTFFEVVSQLSHFAWAALLITWCSIFAPHYFYGFMGVLILVCGVKEFWYDNHYEDAITRGSNLLDFSSYVGGALLAATLLIVKGIVTIHLP